jgi:hypothetical protein
MRKQCDACKYSVNPVDVKPATWKVYGPTWDGNRVILHVCDEHTRTDLTHWILQPLFNIWRTLGIEE